jgi:transposase, IS30 family
MPGQERLEIARRVAAGEPLLEAARAVGCCARTLRQLSRKTGGAARAGRMRSALRLSVQEREEVSRGVLAGESLRAIARALGRAPSTVSREVARVGGRARYRAWRGEVAAAKRALRPKPGKLALQPALREEVEQRLLKWWSPQQVAVSFQRDFPGQADILVSHETIYRSLFVQARGLLKKELTRCLRTGRTQRRPHGRTSGLSGHLPERVMLSERPAEAEDRAVPGHWEGDLLVGRGAEAPSARGWSERAAT